MITDLLGERWAKEMDSARKTNDWCHITRVPAKWDIHGKAAGPIRNAEMAKLADMCVLFWDSKSKGTKNMLENCLKHGVFVKIVKF